MNDVIAKVISQKGHCEVGHKVGDKFILGETTPPGMCPFAYCAILPFTAVLQFGGSFPWEKYPDTGHAACPDGDNPVVFELKLIKE